MYITKEWFLSKDEFKFPNQEGYTDEQITYAIGVAEEWIGRVITGGLIETDLNSNPPLLKITDDIIQAYNDSDKEQVSRAKDIKQALGRAVIFVLETGFNFITGSFSVSIGDRSANELINFESSKNQIEDYIKTLLAKWYDPRLITLSTAVTYDIPKIEGGYIQGEDKPISYKEAQKLFITMLDDKLSGQDPIKLEYTIPNDPNGGKTIKCNNCQGGGTGTDCHSVGQCKVIQDKLDIDKLQDEFIKIWNQTDSDITITKGSLVGKIKKEIMESFVKTEEFPEKIQDSIEQGDNISIVKTSQGIKINGKTAEPPTWDYINKLAVDFLNLRTKTNYHAIHSLVDPQDGKWYWGIGGLKPDITETQFKVPDFISVGGQDTQITSAQGRIVSLTATQGECLVNHKTPIIPSIINDQRIISGKDWKTLSPTIKPKWDDIKDLPLNKENKQLERNLYGINSYIDLDDKWKWSIYGVKPDGTNTIDNPETILLESKDDTGLKAKTIGLLATENECEATHTKEFNISTANDKRIINVQDWKVIKQNLDLIYSTKKDIDPLKDLTEVIKITKNDEGFITGLNLQGGTTPKGIITFSNGSGQITIHNDYGNNKNVIWQTYPQNNGTSAFMDNQGQVMLKIDLQTNQITYKGKELATKEIQTTIAEQDSGNMLLATLTAGKYIVEYNWLPTGQSCNQAGFKTTLKKEISWCGVGSIEIETYWDRVEIAVPVVRQLVLSATRATIVNKSGSGYDHGNVTKIIKVG